LDIDHFYKVSFIDTGKDAKCCLALNDDLLFVGYDSYVGIFKSNPKLINMVVDFKQIKKINTAGRVRAI